MAERPLILVTNDDGVEAEGIQALAKALEAIGDVWVVAPDVENSAKSHAGAWGNRLRGEEGSETEDDASVSDLFARDIAHSLNLKERPTATKVEDRLNTFKVNGTPADCVYLALKMHEPELPRYPQLVASGINWGPNVGDDIYRSGTVAGAREAAFWDVPSIAFSLVSESPRGFRLFKKSKPDFSHAARYARTLAAFVLTHDIGERTFLNVNVPAGEPTEVKLTAQFPPVGVKLLRSMRDAQGNAPTRLGVPNDSHELYKDHISVTPISTDATNYTVFNELEDQLPDIGAEDTLHDDD